MEMWFCYYIKSTSIFRKIKRIQNVSQLTFTSILRTIIDLRSNTTCKTMKTLLWYYSHNSLRRRKLRLFSMTLWINRSTRSLISTSAKRRFTKLLSYPSQFWMKKYRFTQSSQEAILSLGRITLEDYKAGRFNWSARKK